MKALRSCPVAQLHHQFSDQLALLASDRIDAMQLVIALGESSEPDVVGGVNLSRSGLAAQFTGELRVNDAHVIGRVNSVDE